MIIPVYLPPANEVWGKVIFSQACVKNSVHRGRSCPGGVPAPRRVPGPGGCVAGLGGGGLLPVGCLVEIPPGWPLLRAIRILLECILV